MIKITSDSTGDLSAELVEKYQISITPLGIILDGKLHTDGIDIGTKDIKEHVDHGGALPSTNAVSVGDYETFFRKQLEDHEAVVHFTIGSGFSCCYQNACIAAEEFDNVYIIDSQSVSSGQGLMVVLAAEAAQEGKSVEEIVAMSKKMVNDMDFSALLKRLDYLKKGGRCSAITAMGANLLQLRIRLNLVDNKLGVGKKYRGSLERALGEYAKEFCERDDLDTRAVYVVNSSPSGDEQNMKIVLDCLKASGKFDRIIEAKAGCTIFSHVGEGSILVAALRK